MEGIWLGIGILIGIYLSYSWLIGFRYFGTDFYPDSLPIRKKGPAWLVPAIILLFPVLFPILIILGIILEIAESGK